MRRPAVMASLVAVGHLAVCFLSAADDSASAFPGGLGPLSAALGQARDWQRDACLSGVEFRRTDPRVHYRHMPSDQLATGMADEFQLYFHSDSDPRESFNFTSGPSREGGEPGPKRGRYTCLPAFELDARTAIQSATRAGLRLDKNGEVLARLTLLDEDSIKEFTKAAKTNPEAARAVKMLKPRVGAAVWLVSAESRCALVDAETGKPHYVGREFRGCR